MSLAVADAALAVVRDAVLAEIDRRIAEYTEMVASSTHIVSETGAAFGAETWIGRTAALRELQDLRAAVAELLGA
jgi:hypothetical protein